MFQSARHRSPMTPRWVRGLMTGAFLAVISTTHLRVRSGLRLPQYLAAASRRAGRSPGRSSRRSRSGSKRTSSAKSATRCPSSTRSRPRASGQPASIRPARKKSGTRCPSSRTVPTSFYETQRNNVRILIEKIGEKVDPCKIYPAGRALPARALPLQVHRLLRRAVLVGLPDPVQSRGPQGRGRLHRQGPPPPLRRAGECRSASGSDRCEPDRAPATAARGAKRPDVLKLGIGPDLTGPAIPSCSEPAVWNHLFQAVGSLRIGGRRRSVPAEEREDRQQLLARRLAAVLADLEGLGILHGLALLLAQQLDQLGPEPVGDRTRIAPRSACGSRPGARSLPLGTSPR